MLLGSEAYITSNILNVSTRPTRGERPPLVIPSFRSEFLERSFYVTTSYLSNSLPSTLRASNSLNSFKKCANSYILSLEGGRAPSLQSQSKLSLGFSHLSRQDQLHLLLRESKNSFEYANFVFYNL